MKEKITITKTPKHKSATYQRNTSAFEQINYQEVDQPWSVTAYRDVRSFLEKLRDGTGKYCSTAMRYAVKQWSKINWPFLGRCLYRGARFLVVGTKDALLIAAFLIMCTLEFAFEVMAGAVLFFFTAFGSSSPKVKPRTYEPPEEEWWRHKGKPAKGRRRRVTRVTVEIEEFE